MSKRNLNLPYLTVPYRVESRSYCDKVPRTTCYARPRQCDWIDDHFKTPRDYCRSKPGHVVWVRVPISPRANI
jgi:hypothetical protein